MKLSGVSKGVHFLRRKKLVLESKSLWWTAHNPTVQLTSWNFTYNLLIEIEVITGKSQTKAIKASIWDFPVMTEQTRLTFEKTRHLSELYTWARDTVRWHWSADILFGSCQLTITWLSTIKLITDCICLGQLASNAQSLQENSQSECAHYCSHIIFTVYFWSQSSPLTRFQVLPAPPFWSWTCSAWWWVTSRWKVLGFCVTHVKSSSFEFRVVLFRFATCPSLALDRKFLSFRLSSAWCCLVCYIRSLLTAVPLLCWRVLWDWIRQCQLTSVCFKFRCWRGWSKYFSPALLIFQVSRWPNSPLMSSGQRKKITKVNSAV